MADLRARPTALEGSDRSIDARSIVTLIIFFIVNILVIFPLRIPLPHILASITHSALVKLGLRSNRKDEDTKRKYLTVGLEVAPVAGVLLLLASTCIPGSVVRRGIVGSDGVRPYDIMTLFISFAYISLSLDQTGLLRYLASKVALQASKSPPLLWSAFYAFFTLTGLLVGNDPLILSGTPFLAYFTSQTQISDPTAYLFSHFQVANLVSALLVSSNPTNLVLTSAFCLSFLQYSAWLALPTFAGVVVLFPVLRWGVLRGRIPRRLEKPDEKVREEMGFLKDPWGGIFGSGLFLVTIVLLVGLSAGGKLEHTEGVWTVTAPAGLIMLIRDVWYDLRHKGQVMPGIKGNEKERSNKIDEAINEDKNDSDIVQGRRANVGRRNQTTPPASQITMAPVEQSKSTLTPKVSEKQTAGNTPNDHTSPTPTSSSSSPPIAQQSPAVAILRLLQARLPTTYTILIHLPLTLLPFAFSMFILVESLQHTGWIRVFGGWWASWAKVGGVGGCIWLMGMISVLGCNVFGTNIGATILLSRVLQQWQAITPGISERTLYGSVFALAVGSNFGAYSFVFSASLAGLLWKTILAQKGLGVTRWEFAKWNTVPLVVTMIVGCLVVAGEVCVMYKE